MARNWKLMDFECIWNIYSQPILKGIVLIMVGAVQSLFSFFMRLPLDLVQSFLYNLCPMHTDVKYLITAWWVMMSWDLAIWIGGVRVISSKFLARNSFNSRGFCKVIFRKLFFKFFCIYLLLEKLVNRKHFPVKEKFGLFSWKI
jgi:hypothetical protein